jgi:hypothetical protein
VSECDREASIMGRPWPTGGCRATENNFPVNKNDTKVAGYAVAKSYVVSFNDITFVFTPNYQHV